MMLDSAQGGSLAGRPTHDQGGCAFLELTATKPFERRDVEIARIAERRRKRGGVAAEPRKMTSYPSHGWISCDFRDRVASSRRDGVAVFTHDSGLHDEPPL